MPDINNLDSYNLNENPFSQFSELRGGMEEEAPQGGMPQGMGMMPGGMPGGTNQQSPQQPQQGGVPGGMPQQQLPPEISQLQRGQNPGKSKFLIGAIQALENYVKDSDDKDEIATARGVIALLSRLMMQDQEKLGRAI